MPGHGEKTRLQQDFLAQLLCQPTVRQAATAAGISTATATKWLKDAAFCRAYDDAKRQALEGILQFLRSTMTGSIAVLHHIALNSASSDMARIAAARALLEFAFKGIELEEVTGRLIKLEEHLQLSKGA